MSTKKKIIIGIIILLTLVGLCLTFYYVGKKKGEKAVTAKKAKPVEAPAPETETTDTASIPLTPAEEVK